MEKSYARNYLVLNKRYKVYYFQHAYGPIYTLTCSIIVIREPVTLSNCDIQN